MNIDLSRRSFLKLAGAGAAATSLGAMGFEAAEAATAAHVRAFKLATATETRNVCTYCSVACGILMYSRGDLAAGEKAELIHIEGDADHPTNRGTLCPTRETERGTLRVEIKSVNHRFFNSSIRLPSGADRWEDISWEDAFDKIARAIKDDRDANFIAENAEGVTVNRWTTAGFLAASGSTNESAWTTYKVVRSLGIVGFDNQARV